MIVKIVPTRLEVAAPLIINMVRNVKSLGCMKNNWLKVWYKRKKVISLHQISKL